MAVAKKIAGVDVLLKVKDSSGYVVVGGQTSCTLNRGAETIDISDKTTGGYKASMAGLLSWSIDADGFVVLGDRAYELLEDAFMKRQVVEAEIRMGGSEDADGITYKGSGYIVDMPLEFDQSDAVTFSLSIEGASALERKKGVVSAELSEESTLKSK